MNRPSTTSADRPRILLMPEFMSIGGGQMIYLRKALWLKANGYHVAVASAGGVLEDELSAAGIPHLTLADLGAQGAFPNTWQRWGATIDALVAFVDEQQVTVLDAHPIVPVLAAREVARHRHVGVKYEFLGGQTHLIPSDVWIDEVTKGNFTTYRGAAAEQIEDRLHIDRDCLWTAPLAVDFPQFEQAPAETMRDTLGLAAADFIVLNACRHDADKLVHIFGLADELVQLMAEFPHLHAVFAGDGAEHQRVRDYVLAKLPHDRVHLPGMVRDMSAAVHGCDVLYGMGSVCSEAAIARTPVIIAPAESILSHRYPGGFPRDGLALGYFAEYGVYQTGNPVDGMRPTTIAERMRPLLADPGKAADIACRAYDFLADNHHPDAVMQHFTGYYQDVHDAAMARRSSGIATEFSIAHAPAAELPVSVEIAVPREPAAVVPPWQHWSQLVAPLQEHGIAATIVAADAVTGECDAIVAVSVGHGSTVQAWDTMRATGTPLLCVGRYRDQRRFRTLWRSMHSILGHPASERDQLLAGLRQGMLRIDGVDPIAAASQSGHDESVQRVIVAGADCYLAGDDAELAALAAATGAMPTGTRTLRPWGDALPDGSADRFEQRHGRRDFILCAGPVDPRHNQALVALAAGSRDLVLVGPPDPDYQYLVRTCLGDDNRIMFLSTIDGQQFADALAAAAVFVHAGIGHCSDEQLRQAGSSDVPIVMSRHQQAAWLADSAVVAHDELDPDSIASAIDRAVSAGRRAPQPGALQSAESAARELARAVYAQLADAQPSNTLYDASIVLVAGDACEQLTSVVVHLAGDALSDVQYVIVDNASSDATGALLAQLEGDVSIVRIDERVSPADAARLGREQARGMRVVAVDVASVADPAQVSRLVRGSGTADDVALELPDAA